jgi:hypothetical protein
MTSLAMTAQLIARHVIDIRFGLILLELYGIL